MTRLLDIMETKLLIASLSSKIIVLLVNNLSQIKLTVAKLLALHWQTTQRILVGLVLLIISIFMIPAAQAASCKLPQSYYKNVSCTANKGYFLAVSDFSAPVALIDSQGKKVVDLSAYQRVDANKLASGLLPVQRHSKVGYINMQGREVVPTIYNILEDSSGWARGVVEGRIIVNKDGNYGVIDSANRTIVPFSAAISTIDNYRNGKARVTKGKATSWLDINGKTIADSTSRNSNLDSRLDQQKANSNPANTTAKSSNSVRLAPSNSTGFTTLQAEQRDGKWGFIDDYNVTMITYSFDEVRPFSQGLAAVKIDGKWGFVNLGGDLVIPLRFGQEALTSSGSYKGVGSLIFVEDKAWIGSLANGSKMCINKEGTNVGCD